MFSIKDARDFMARKGLEGLAPVLTSSEDMLDKLLSPIEEITIRKMKEMDPGKPEKWPMKESSTRAFFRMVRRNLPRMNKQTKRKLAVNMVLYTHLLQL